MSTPVTTLQDAGAGAPGKATSRAHMWILVVIASAQLMVVLDTTIMIIALPSAQHALGFSNTDRQWVVTVYTLAFGGFLLLGGRISDMFGPKRTLMIGVTGFALASALGGASQTTLMLIGARGLQGLFGALLAPSVLSILTSTFSDPRERGRAFGIYATIAIAGSAFGLILGGFLTQYVDWRWCLYVNLPIAGLVLFGAFRLIPTCQGVPGIRLDVLGVVLGCGGLVALVYGLGEAGTSGWGATDVIVALVAAARAPRRVRPVAEQGPQSASPVARGAQQEPGGLVHHDPAGRDRHVRDLPVPDLPAADRRPLLTAQDRHRLPPADGHERAGGDAGGQPPDAARADPAAGGPGPAAGRARRFALHPADARCLLLVQRAAERAAPGLRARAGHRAVYQHRHPARRSRRTSG